MRIATSTIYSQQATSMDNLQTQFQTQGQQLSTGKSVNAPADNAPQIGFDLNLHAAIAVETQQATNIQAATAQLTATDSALADLTAVLQSTRSLAIRGASDTLAPGDRKDISGEVDQYLQEAIAISNTQYGPTFLFAGSVQSSKPPITTAGSPVSAVVFSGNEQTQAPMLVNGQSFALSPTLQQSFNHTATDGSPSVFDILMTLRDTLSKGLVTDKSSVALNLPGQVIYGVGSPTPTTLATLPTPLAITPKPDSTGQYTISINNSDVNGIQHVNAFTFPAGTVIDDATAASITGAINAKNTGPSSTGLTASFNAQTQRLVLTNTGGGPFYVTDVASPGATNTSNFTSMFALVGSATLPQTVSTQLGDMDNALNVTLNARSLVGSRINALAQINTQVTTGGMDDTNALSAIEDTDIAKVTTQFTATQVALTASYSTTQRLEQKDLFDYL